MEMYASTNDAYEVSKCLEEKSEINPHKENFGFRKHETRERFPIENAQELAENAHKTSASQILELNGQYLTQEGKERLERGVDVIRAVPYRNGAENIGSFSYHDGKSEINICAIDVGQIERTTQHETNHFASYNMESIENPELSKKHVNKRSGIHCLEYTEDSKKRIIEFVDQNRGFNEGITQMYTNRQLELQESGKGLEAARQNGYMFATELSEQVEQIIGVETVAQAYYGGKMEMLKKRIDVLGGNGTFERLSKDMDKVTYSRDFTERFWAMRDAQEILAMMSEGEVA